MKDKQYWLRLAERYFEATTTEAEESELRQFAATTSDPDFDALRAVMGYAAVRRRNSGQRKTLSYRRPMGIAAALLLVIGLSVVATRQTDRQEGDCVAYVNGVQVTDEGRVFALMSETMSNLHLSSLEADPVESQLEIMFDGL